MFAIKYEMIISAGIDYLNSIESYYKARLNHGFKRGDMVYIRCNGYPDYPDIDNKYDYLERYRHALYTITDITGIPWDIIVTAARYYNRHGDACNWERCLTEKECEKLITVLTAVPAEYNGVYSNPYTEKGIDRLERARYETYAPVWGNW